ncbi:MAG: MBL fold metallo-hydrolase [Lachnospiraceae bacterium]|nr:MBL fold metallo-hydrolase [Lachnospiraceae bacterium]
MEIKRLVLGMVRTNCYIAYTEESKKAVVIDPAADSGRIMEELAVLGVTPEAVLLTHGHFDHMLAADTLRKQYRIPVCILKEDAELLEQPELNGSELFMRMSYGIIADELLLDGQQLRFLDGTLRVIASPGHTAGSCCYYQEAERVLFSGDTLFQGSVGRTDLPTGKASLISVSIREKLFVLPEDTLVLSGHGMETTIGEEKEHNPYVV